MDALETARLRLAPWTAEDAGLLIRLAALPAVMRHIGTGETWPRERALEHHERALAHWREHGFGWRVARTRADGVAVGLIALNFAGSGLEGLAPGDHELGWWLDPAHQGAGYASEGGRALRDEAFARLSANVVVARIQPENAASARVAAAIGLEPWKRTRGRAGEPVTVHRLTAAQWRHATAH